MEDIFRNYLFTKHILVADNRWTIGQDNVTKSVNALGTVIALAKKFGIKITKGAELAHKWMIRDCEINLGENVPAPFYLGFPNSVRELTPNQLLFDQLYHYVQTYGMGWWDQPGHSVLEDKFREVSEFKENVTPKEFVILTENEAYAELEKYVIAMLEGNRPLNEDQKAIVKASMVHFLPERILPQKIPCKDTVIFLFCDFHMIGTFTPYLKLSDTIKILEYIQFHTYHSENLNKLNLKNRDRVFLTKILNWFEHQPMQEYFLDIEECYEKRKIWKGFLHHIHYKPVTACMKKFMDSIRNNENYSAYHYFEQDMAKGNHVTAARNLHDRKGSGAVLRNLNYILSRCNYGEEVREVLENV